MGKLNNLAFIQEIPQGSWILLTYMEIIKWKFDDYDIILTKYAVLALDYQEKHHRVSMIERK